MKRVKFKDAGKWADSDTTIPQIEVKAGEVCEVSAALADIIVEASKGEIISPAKKTAAKKTPTTKDKAAAESK